AVVANRLSLRVLSSLRSSPATLSLSPVLGGEGRGEGLFLRAEKRPPLTLTLSPAYRGEGRTRFDHSHPAMAALESAAQQVKGVVSNAVAPIIRHRCYARFVVGRPLRPGGTAWQANRI